MLPRAELEKIKERLIAEANGLPVEHPVTEEEMKLLKERLVWEKRNMGFFNMCISFKQAKLLNLLENHEQLILWGGVRSTKTNFQCLAIILLATGYWPVSYEERFMKDGQRVLKPTYALREKPIVDVPCDIGVSLLTRNLQRRPGAFEAQLKAMIPKPWIADERNVQDYADYIQLVNGSKIWFMSAAAGDETYQSAAYRVVIIDENQPQKIFSELTSRVGQHPPLLIMGFHTNKGKDWAYDLFIKPEEQHKTPPYRAVERVSMLDNPFITLKAKERKIEEWREEGTLEKRLWGGFDDLVGMVYKKFDKKVHTISAADIPEFIGGEPPKDWPIICGLDCHHSEKGCAASWIAINPDNGRCYLFKEYESTDTPSVWIDDLNKINEQYPAIVCEADPSMDATDNRGYNLWDEFRRKCTLPLRKATRDHAMGIHAVTEAFANLRDYNGDPVDGKPGLLICDHCVRTIEQVEGYHRKGGAVNSVEKVNDEFCDTLRYMMVTRPAEQFGALPEVAKQKPKAEEPAKRKGGFIYSAPRPTDERKGAFIYAPFRPKQVSS